MKIDATEFSEQEHNYFPVVSKDALLIVKPQSLPNDTKVAL